MQIIFDDAIFEPILTDSEDERDGCAPQWTRCDLCDLRLMGVKGYIRDKKCEFQICMKFFNIEKLRADKGIYMKKTATIKDWEIERCEDSEMIIRNNTPELF